MDFSALMLAATRNAGSVQTKKESVLVTKLSAPKKEEKKVDTEAIKKRLDLEKNKPIEKKPKPKVNITEKNGLLTSTKGNSQQKPKPQGIQTKEQQVKQKYDSKEHAEKHKQFMNNVHKIGNKSELKPEKKQNSTNHSKDKKKDIKPTPGPARLSFKDLMNLAEKGIKDPSVLAIASKGNSPASNSPRTLSPEPNRNKGDVSLTKTKTETKAPNSASKSNNNSAQDANLTKIKDKTVTSSKKGTPSAETKNGLNKISDSKKNQQTHSKSEEGSSKKKLILPPHPQNDKNSSNKRSNPSNQDGPPEKKLLSDAALAKLAFREGRKVPPPPLKNTSLKGEFSKNGNNSLQSSLPKKQATNIINPEMSQPEKQRDNSAAVSAWDRLMGASKPKEKPKATSIKIHSDEEDDEEFDDFIDDGDADVDYSKEIRQIFGYDKRKYMDEDFDDRQMESRYADIMKEEIRSARIGREEDIRDMLLEEEEKKMKKMRKKK